MSKKLNLFMQQLPRWKKTIIAMTFDICAALFCFYAALYIRIPDLEFKKIPNIVLYKYIIIAVVSQFISFYQLGLYKGVWRFSSTPDLVRIIKGTTVAILSTLLLLFLFNRLLYIPRSSFIINWCLLVLTLGGGRFAYRLWTDNISLTSSSLNNEDVLIIGAGSAGMQLLREIKSNGSIKYNVIGFIDDDQQIQGKTILNTPILGKITDLKDVVNLTGVKKVFIALPSVQRTKIRSLVKSTSSEVIFKILPAVGDILSGGAHLSQLRDLNIEDLLGRDPISLDSNSIAKMLSNKIIMITGGGGSIGSEICLQVSNFNPSMLVLFEQSEFNLYQIEKDLKSKFPNLILVSAIGDVRNRKRLTQVISKFKPNVIFHAAAYKHVPLMEENIFECISTNIGGTKNVAEIAKEFSVEKFIMVSTDKAVNPTNIMGTSKRVAEMVCQNLWRKSHTTKFITVRFGNVLGSSGSVIPLFKKQIEEGGPVTVTHKEITRYFMSIPEASQLVLQAGAQGRGGEIFILDMGQPIRIFDLAKQMIRLSGLIPEEDIQIKFTGLRPGEKLFEELLMNSEDTLETLHPKVNVAKATGSFNNFEHNIVELLKLESEENPEVYKMLLKKIVPEYITPEEHLLTHENRVLN